MALCIWSTIEGGGRFCSKYWQQILKTQKGFVKWLFFQANPKFKYCISQRNKVKQVEWIPRIKYMEEDERCWVSTQLVHLTTFYHTFTSFFQWCTLSFCYMTSYLMLEDEVLALTQWSSMFCLLDLTLK